jgi:hypothetical protein
VTLVVPGETRSLDDTMMVRIDEARNVVDLAPPFHRTTIPFVNAAPRTPSVNDPTAPGNALAGSRPPIDIVGGGGCGITTIVDVIVVLLPEGSSAV